MYITLIPTSLLWRSEPATEATHTHTHTHTGLSASYLSSCSLLIHWRYACRCSSSATSLTNGRISLTHSLAPSCSSPPLNPPTPPSPLTSPPPLREMQVSRRPSSSEIVLRTSPTTSCHSLWLASLIVPDSCKHGTNGSHCPYFSRNVTQILIEYCINLLNGTLRLSLLKVQKLVHR